MNFQFFSVDRILAGVERVFGATEQAFSMNEKTPAPNGSTALAWARKLVVGVIGGTILMVGVALIFLPGPAFIVIPIGLAVLATEFVWARRLLHRLRAETRKILERRKKGSNSNDIFDNGESQPTL